MTLRKKESGSAAVECDCPTCHFEVLARTEGQAVEQAAAEGWRGNPDGSHLCPDCQAGNCPGAAVAEGRFGAARLPVLLAKDVTADEEVRALDGEVVGRFVADGKAGSLAEIDFVQAPEGKQPIAGAQSCLTGRPRTAGTEVAWPANGWQNGDMSQEGPAN